MTKISNKFHYNCGHFPTLLLRECRHDSDLPQQSLPSPAVEKLKKVTHIRMPQRSVVISRAAVPEAFAQMHNRNDGNVRGSAQDESHRETETGEKSGSATKRTHFLQASETRFQRNRPSTHPLSPSTGNRSQGDKYFDAYWRRDHQGQKLNRNRLSASSDIDVQLGCHTRKDWLWEECLKVMK